MSCFGCFKSSRGGSPTRGVEERETRCAFREEGVSERVTDLIGGSLGSGKQVVAVAIPSKRCMKVPYQRSDRCSQRDESKPSARVVTLLLPSGDESESEAIEEFDRAIAELRRGANVAEEWTTAHLKTSEVGMEADAPVKEEGLNQFEGEEQALSGDDCEY
ncbi:MAG: hypothetical protein OXF02_05615 [Simkaniaceae bacterium]|nr:hypothetical protein [Simkaniaceae bacterium]